MAQVEIEQEELKRMRQDISDMHNSKHAAFVRCEKCGRLSDYGYRCFYCSHDHSTPECNCKYCIEETP